MLLEGTTMVVSGVGPGLGREIAEAAGRDGANVVIGARTEANLKASLDHARNLLRAKDFNEVMQLQSAFLRNQFGMATEQFKKMTTGAGSGSNDDKEKPELI